MDGRLHLIQLKFKYDLNLLDSLLFWSVFIVGFLFNIFSLLLIHHNFDKIFSSFLTGESASRINILDRQFCFIYIRFIFLILIVSHQVVSFVLPSACDLEMSSSQKGWLNSIIFVGMMVGGYLFGGAADIKVHFA